MSAPHLPGHQGLPCPGQRESTAPPSLPPCRIFVPSYSAALHFELGGCKVNTSSPCALRVTLGSATLPSRSQKVLNCSGDCSGVLASPPWEKWLPITVESLSGPGTSVSFQLKASFTGVCQLREGGARAGCQAVSARQFLSLCCGCPSFGSGGGLPCPAAFSS